MRVQIEIKEGIFDIQKLGINCREKSKKKKEEK